MGNTNLRYGHNYNFHRTEYGYKNLYDFMTKCVSDNEHRFTCYHLPPKQPRTKNRLHIHFMRFPELHGLYTSTQMTPYEVLQNAEIFRTKKIGLLQNLRHASICKSLNWANLPLRLKFLRK